jgi:hypothetical protein
MQSLHESDKEDGVKKKEKNLKTRMSKFTDQLPSL